MKRIIAIVAASALSAAAGAQTVTSQAHVTRVSTGWGYDSFSLFLSTPLPNPAACPLTDSATVSSDSPGYKTYYAAALTAFTNDFPVTVVISNTSCEGQRPKIIGVSLTH